LAETAEGTPWHCIGDGRKRYDSRRSDTATNGINCKQPETGIITPKQDEMQGKTVL